MKQQTRVLTAAFLMACGMIGGLTACSKQDEMQPSSQASANQPNVIDGRIVFKNHDEFYKTIDAIKHKSGSDLDVWESQLNYTSLRKSVGEEQIALKEEFMFPAAYAAIINAEGVYQIGTEIFWYNKGVKLQFHSLADYQSARKGGNVLHKTLYSGYKLSGKVKEVSVKSSQNRTYMNAGSGVDARYQYQFSMWYQSGNQRKIVYETYVFTDQDAYGTYHSVLAINMKLEYYGRRGWRDAGELRVVDAQFTGQCRAYSGQTDIQFLPVPLGPLPYATQGIGVSYHSEQNYNSTLWLADCYNIVAPYGSNDINWDFTLNGTISSWISSDRDHTYTIQGTELWK